MFDKPVRASPVAALGASIALLAVASLARQRASLGEPSIESSPGVARTPSGPVDLNTATEAELETLPRIGPALARRIVEHRRRTGGFRRLEDLDAVPGVGPAVLRAIAGRATVTTALPGSNPESLPDQRSTR